MGFDRRFTAVTLLLVALIGVALVGLVLAFQRSDLGATRVVAVLLVVAAVVALVRHVERTNVMLARFVEALHHRDVAARFSARGGASFATLGSALNGAMRDLQTERTRGLEELRFWEALIDDIPTALLTIDEAQGVRTLNKAARALFGRHDGVRPEDYVVYGARFAARLTGEAAAQEILTLDLAGGPQRAIVGVAAITRLGAPVRVVAVEPVQGALDAVEVGTQSDVVRVLTHEILNSLTPVTSLAGTAAVLLGEEEPDIAEARLAVLTLARRAEELRRFIDSYRAVARPPEPRRRRFAAPPFAGEIARLFGAEWLEHRLAVTVDPAVVIDADPDLLAQVLINLLRNAAQATGAGGHIDLRILGSTNGGTVIEVEDDGPGIADAVRRDIFLPFFTTRAEGTGVGLNLVRQIMVAHGWRIDVATGGKGGALFRLTSG